MDYSEYFLDPYEPIYVDRNRLPHWYQDGSRIFMMTFRLGDSIPKKVLDELAEKKERWLREQPEPWTASVHAEHARLFHKPQFEWMDNCMGACLLGQSPLREILENVLGYFEGQRHEHISWVIMPNHVHTLTLLYEAWRPKEIVASWKKASSTQINVITGRRGTLWFKDYFETMIRNRNHLNNCIRYIRNNPAKARIRSDRYTLFENEYAKSIGGPG